MPIALRLPTTHEDHPQLPRIRAVVESDDGATTLQALDHGTHLATRSGRNAQVLWVGRRRLTAARLATAPRLAPVLIRRGALGAGVPAHDILLSPEQRVRFTDPRAARWFGNNELCVAAVQLTFIPGVEQITSGDVVYVHPILAQSATIRVNGCWIDAAHAGDAEMADPASPQRAEILHLFPELVTLRGWLAPTPPAGNVALMAEARS